MPRSRDSVVVAEVQDAEFSLGLLSATASGETTLLNLGEPYEGRGRGLIVDGVQGAAPQLAITRSTQESAEVTLRRGSADVSWLPVGDIISVEQHWSPWHEDPTITIESPNDDETQDLGDHGYFTLSGSADTPGSSVDRIEVSGPEGLIGTATLFFDEAGLGWEFAAAAPDDGTYTYSVRIFDRAGRSASDQIEIEVIAVDEEDIVTAPNAFLFNSQGDPENQGELEILVEDEETGPVSVMIDRKPAFSPGDFIVAAVSEATPKGALLTVRSIDRVGDRWVVETESASLEDVFFQVDIDETIVLDDVAGTHADDDAHAMRAPVGELDEDGETIQTDIEYSDGPGDRVWVETENVDLDDLPEDWNDGEVSGDAITASTKGITSNEARITPAASGSFNSSLSMSVNLLATWEKGSKSGPTLREMSKEIADPYAKAQALNDKYEQIKNEDKLVLALGFRGQASLEFKAVLDTSIEWKWGFIPVGISIDELTVKAVVTLKASASLKASVSSEVGGSWWNAIGGFKLPTFTIMAGPVPVVFTNDIAFALKGKIGIEFSAELPEISHKSVYTYGFTYSDRGGYKTLSEEPKRSGSLGPFNGWDGTKLGGKLTASFGPEVEVSSKIYSVAGPTLTIGGMLKFTGAVELALDKGEWVPSASYKLAIVVELKGGVKIVIWKKELGRYDFIPSTFEIPIFEGKTSKPKTAPAMVPWVRGGAPPGTNLAEVPQRGLVLAA